VRGLALDAGFDEEARERWELDIINWLSGGETLLRDNFPEHFRELTVFAARHLLLLCHKAYGTLDFATFSGHDIRLGLSSGINALASLVTQQ
jgi:hypothetical protein